MQRRIFLAGAGAIALAGCAAPVLGEPPLDQAVARLKQALRDFEAHRGPLAPHFAYGALEHAQYTRAHLMHMANHWAKVVQA